MADVGSGAAERACRGKLADRFSRSSRVETMLRGCTVLCGLSTYAPYLVLPKVAFLSPPPSRNLSLSLQRAYVCLRHRAHPRVSLGTCAIPHGDVGTHTCDERATKVRIIGRDGTKKRLGKKVGILIRRVLVHGRPPTDRWPHAESEERAGKIEKRSATCRWSQAIGANALAAKALGQSLPEIKAQITRG